MCASSTPAFCVAACARHAQPTAVSQYMAVSHCSLSCSPAPCHHPAQGKVAASLHMACYYLPATRPPHLCPVLQAAELTSPTACPTCPRPPPPRDPNDYLRPAPRKRQARPSRVPGTASSRLPPPPPVRRPPPPAAGPTTAAAVVPAGQLTVVNRPALVNAAGGRLTASLSSVAHAAGMQAGFSARCASRAIVGCA